MTKLSGKYRTNEQARRALREAVGDLHGEGRDFTDMLIRVLAGKGFAIVSTNPQPTARRGNAPAYTGPGMIGTSHSARLCR